MGKTALITGASNGIGYELARINAEKGDNLVLVARSKNKLDELKRGLEAKYKISVCTICKDLSVPAAPLEVYDEMKKKNISVDYLINNAGFGDFGPFAESDWNKLERMINLNVSALSHLTRLCLPEMIKRGSGKILNLASTASFQPGPMMSVYFATKAYVLSFSEALNEEVREFGITVTALCPGSTQSGFQAAATDDDRKLAERNHIPSSREVAEFGYKAMMMGKSVAIHGLKNTIVANSIRFLPRSLVVRFARKMQSKKFKSVQ